MTNEQWVMGLQKVKTEMVITLRPGLTEDLEQLAACQQTSTEEFITTALRRYMRHLQEQKIQKEAEVFRTMHTELLKQYQGQVVAIHNGDVVDHDEDFATLHQRIRDRFGSTAVLLRRVTTEPERVLTFRSPRFERGWP